MNDCPILSPAMLQHAAGPMGCMLWWGGGMRWQPIEGKYPNCLWASLDLHQTLPYIWRGKKGIRRSQKGDNIWHKLVLPRSTPASPPHIFLLPTTRMLSTPIITNTDLWNCCSTIHCQCMTIAWKCTMPTWFSCCNEGLGTSRTLVQHRKTPTEFEPEAATPPTLTWD